MAKTKKKTRVSSDKVNKKEKKKKLNPFEVHVNKEKLKVLGKKSKNDRGLPGVSREKAINKRKNTLLQEYKLQNKSNKFVDKRIGEHNKNLSEEDRFVARYAKIRAKNEKKLRFNLADEVLTHRGQVLSEIEKFADNQSDEDSDDGGLQSEFVENAHFGGGIFEKGTSDGAKSHKDLIDQLIAESKKRKAEKQKLKEQTIELTEKLDTEWKDLIPLVSKSSKNDEIEKPKADDFDKVMRELKFEARGHPSDRLKSEEEIAKEEKEKLEQLEKERLQRMHGFTSNQNTKKHHSADDLDDNFEYEETTDDVPLSYNVDGLPNVEVTAEVNGKPIGQDKEIDFDESDERESDSDDSNDEESTEDDNLSDLKEDSEKSENSDLEENETIKEEPLKPIPNNKNIITDLLQRKEIMDKAREELPYTFKLPQNYEDLQSLLIEETPERQHVIIERMIKCNHPSLGAGNKESLGTLFVYLLQYLNDISSQDSSGSDMFKIFYNLLPHFYELAHLNSLGTHKAIVEVIKEKHLEYRKCVKKYPGNEVLLFLKLVSYLFSTSDFKHAVVTPCFAFMDQMLNSCKIRTNRDIAYGLFLCTLAAEYTKLSKRFLPSVINFLSGILYLAIPKSGIRIMKICPPFKISSNTLVVVNNNSETVIDLKVPTNYLFGTSNNEENFKIQVIYLSLKLIDELLDNIEGLPSVCEIFSHIEKHLGLVPTNNYPEVVRKKMENLRNRLENLRLNRKIEYLIAAKARPKALRLYEPNIQKIYDGKRHKVTSKEKAETNKLIHKLRKERKGALREIRRDQAFLAKVKIKKQIQSDTERKEKVKRLFAEASIQQSELNAMDRKKKRKN